MDYKLISYAMDFSSFLLENVKSNGKIRSIILFGSVARGEADKSSDIDLFIDTKEERELEEESNRALEEFTESVKFKAYWKLFNVKNSIKLTVGELEKWEELKSSIVSNGITLYGKYQEIPAGGRNLCLFVWENIKPNTKRVLFNKKMLGYNHYGKFYAGLLQEYGGVRLGKGCIMVPLENYAKFMQLFRSFEITVKIRKVLDYL